MQIPCDYIHIYLPFFSSTNLFFCVSCGGVRGRCGQCPHLRRQHTIPSLVVTQFFIPKLAFSAPDDFGISLNLHVAFNMIFLEWQLLHDGLYTRQVLTYCIVGTFYPLFRCICQYFNYTFFNYNLWCIFTSSELYLKVLERDFRPGAIFRLFRADFLTCGCHFLQMSTWWLNQNLTRLGGSDPMLPRPGVTGEFLQHFYCKQFFLSFLSKIYDFIFFV